MKLVENHDSNITRLNEKRPTFNSLKALDHLPTTIAYINKNLIYEYVNIKYTEFVKKEKINIIGKNVREVVGEINYKKIKPHINNVLAGNNASFDCTFDTRDKSEKFANCQYIPNKSSNGDLLGFYVYLKDITKQKQYDNLFDYLWKVSTDKNLNYKDQIERVLYATRTYLEFEHAAITKINTNLCTIYASSSEAGTFPAGLKFIAQDTFCNTTFEENHRIEYTNCEIENPKIYKKSPFQSYIGEPILVSGKKIGSISFIAKEIKSRAFSNRERALVSFIGRWIGALLSENYERERLIDSERKLSLLSKEYETIIDSVPSLIWYKDTKNNILNANKLVLDSLGVNRSEISGQHSSVYYPEVADKFFKDDQEIISSKKSKTGIVESLVDEHGNITWVKTDKIPLFNQQSEVDRILVISTDVTTEVESRTRLEHKRNLLEQAYQTTPALMHSINSSGEIELVSDEWLKNFGYKREEVLGRPSIDFLTDASRRNAKKSLSKAFNSIYYTAPIKNKKYEILTKSGEVREVLISAFPEKNSNGQVNRLRAVLLDVTERNRLDRALHASNKELEDFAYVASHDLQAPLRHISVFTEILKDEIDPSLYSQDVKEALSVILTGTKKMQNLISDLLLFSKADKSPLRIEEFKVNDVINDVLDILKSEHKNIFEYVKVKNLSYIKADKLQISQIFQNLIENSLKFSDKNREPSIIIEMEDHLDYWELSVEDNGIGFDSKYSNKVFKLFQRLHNDSSYNGTGIGLSICKKVVDRHRGKIKVHSEKNKGTRFNFTIRKYLKNENLHESS